MGVRFAKLITSSTRYVKKRSFKNFDESLFLQQIRDTSWWDVYKSTDPDEAVEIFTTKVNFILDQMAPMKTFQTTSKYCPWLTEEAKVMIKDRNTAQEHFSENKNEINFEKFKTLRNKVTKKLRNDKLQWQKQKLNSCNNDPGKLWKNILGWLNWCSSGSPSKLYHAGQIVTSPAKLANIMNNFFVNKITAIQHGLPPPTDDPLSTLQGQHNNIVHGMCASRHSQKDNTWVEEQQILWSR